MICRGVPSRSGGMGEVAVFPGGEEGTATGGEMTGRGSFPSGSVLCGGSAVICTSMGEGATTPSLAILCGRSCYNFNLEI